MSKRISETIVDRQGSGEEFDIGDLLEMLDDYEAKYERKRQELRKLLGIVLVLECECDLDTPCVRCRILDEWAPGASSMQLTASVNITTTEPGD